MSTKSSVYLSDDDSTHIYTEAFDDENLYVSRTSDDGRIKYERCFVLSLEEAKAIAWWYNKRVNRLMTLASKTDEQIQSETEQDVDLRINKARESRAKGGRAYAAGLYGLMDYGDVDDPREDQIGRGVEAAKESREWAKCQLERLGESV